MMSILTLVLCSLAIGWLVIRLLSLFSIPIDEAIKILNIIVPKAPVVSIDNLTADSVGLHWEISSGSQSSQTTPPPSSEDIAGYNSSSLSAVSHFLMYVNGFELARIPGTEKSVILNNLTPNSHYQVDLVVFNNLNFRSKSYSIFLRTSDRNTGDVEQKLLNIADDSTQVLPCDPKLLYEDNVDEKLKQQIQPVQIGGRSRSNTVDNASIASLSTLAFPNPTEITNIDDLKYHLERGQEDLRNTMNQKSRALSDYAEQEKEYKSVLVELNERIKIEDKSRAAAKQELSSWEDLKLSLRSRIDKSKLNLSSLQLNIEKKEQQIQDFAKTLREKELTCEKLEQNEESEFLEYEQEIKRIQERTSALLVKNQSLEEAVKAETITRKRLEVFKSKMSPIFTALSKATNAEGELEKDGFTALEELRHEHAEWYQSIKSLIDKMSQDRAHGIAQKLKVETKLEQHRRQLISLKAETKDLKAAKRELSANLFRNTYLNNDSASSYTNLSMMTLLNNGRNLMHQPSIPSLSDGIANNNNPVNGANTWGYNHGRIPSQTTSLEQDSQFDASVQIQNTSYLTLLPNELLNDDGENFFKKMGGNASMNRGETFYSTTSSTNNPFGSIPDSSMPIDYNADMLPYTRSMGYTLLLENNSLNLTGHNSNGNNSPSHPLAGSPPVSSHTHMSNPSGSNLIGSGFANISSVYSNDSFLPVSSPQNTDYPSLSHLVFHNDSSQTQKDAHASSFSPRRLSKTFKLFQSNDPSNGTAATSELQTPTHSSSLNTSRFLFNWKKPPKSPQEELQLSFSQLNSLSPSGLDTLSPGNLARDRSGSFNSHTSNLSSSIWNNNTNSGTNFHRFLESPLQLRQSLEVVGMSSPVGRMSPEPSVPLTNLPQAIHIDTPHFSITPNAAESSTATETLLDPAHRNRKYSAQSSNSNLSREASNISTNSSQLQEIPSSPSYFKKFFAGTSPGKHEKNLSISSNTISTSGDSELGESAHGGTATTRKLFKINRKNSVGASTTTGLSTSANGSSSISSQLVSSSSIGSNASSTSPQQPSVPSSSTTSKKLKKFLFQKRKGHEEGSRTDTEEVIEEASDESSLNE